MAKKLVYHQSNGTVVVETDVEGRTEPDRVIVVRFVYADKKLAEKLLRTVREHLVEQKVLEA